MDTTGDPDRRLAVTLGDACLACIWTAAAMLAVAGVGWGMSCSLRVWVAGLVGLDEHSLAIVWVGSPAEIKAIALSFLAAAFGLWVWRRRLLLRIG